MSAMVFLTGCGQDRVSSSQQQLELTANGLTSLIINNKVGTIDVIGTNTSNITVRADIKVTNISSDKLNLKLEAQGDQANLDAFFTGQFLAMGSGEINLTISMPEDLVLELHHDDGDIKISNLAKGTVIFNKNGDMYLNQLLGDIFISNEDGNAQIEDVEGKVTINNKNGDLSVQRINGSVIIDAGWGALNLNEVANDAYIVQQSSNKKVNIKAVKGIVTQDKK
jgi:hypothetical protein